MPAKRQTYDSPRQLARRVAILKTTRELLTKRGYEGTTVRDVAEQAGVAKGTLYNIYGGKDALIFAAVIDVRDNIVFRTGELAPNSGLDQVFKSNQAVMEEIAQNPNYTEAIAHAIFGAPPAEMLVASLIHRPIKDTVVTLEAAKELGQIEPDTNSPSVARQLEMQRWGLILSVFIDDLPIDQLNREVTHAMVRVLGSIALPKGIEIVEKQVAELGMG